MTHTFETERLLLRPYQLGDQEAIYQMSLDPEVNRYTGEAPVTTREEVLGIIQDVVFQDYQKHGFGRFALVYKPEHKYIGFTGLKYLEDYEEVDIGYRLMPKYWGKGIATESGWASLHFGFETLNLDHIIGLVYPENIASVKVLHKLGFEFERKVEESGKEAHKYRLDKTQYSPPGNILL